MILKKKLLMVSIVLITLAAMACGCGLSGKEQRISDIAYNKVRNHVNYVYVREGDREIPFIVAEADYQKGKTLIVRRDLLPTFRRFNDYYSYYENSEIDNYLNNEYLGELNEIDGIIEPVNIVIAAESAIGLTGKEVTKIGRKVFLLSYVELGLAESPTVAPEGKALKIFKKSENRIACDESGNPECYIMRSPNTYHDSMVYCMGDDAVVGGINAFDESGIRPAICVDNSACVEKYEAAGHNSYIIKLK